MRILGIIALVAGFLALWTLSERDYTVVNVTNLTGPGEMVAALTAASEAHEKKEFLYKTVLVIIASLITLFFTVRAFKRAKRKSEMHLELVRGVKERAKIDHEFASMCGANVLFDDTTRTVNFVRHGKVYSVSYSKLTGVEWEWVTKGRFERWDYLKFLVNDPNNPYIKLNMGKRSAELWHAKVPAIVNS